MEYVMSSRWSLMERFDITDGAGTPLYEARGHLGSRISLLDSNGQEVADIHKHLAIVLAIEAIHDERRQQESRGAGIGFGAGG